MLFWLFLKDILQLLTLTLTQDILQLLATSTSSADADADTDAELKGFTYCAQNVDCKVNILKGVYRIKNLGTTINEGDSFMIVTTNMKWIMHLL